jgi:hypothetical protein
VCRQARMTCALVVQTCVVVSGCSMDAAALARFGAVDSDGAPGSMCQAVQGWSSCKGVNAASASVQPALGLNSPSFGSRYTQLRVLRRRASYLCAAGRIGQRRLALVL